MLAVGGLMESVIVRPELPALLPSIVITTGRPEQVSVTDKLVTSTTDVELVTNVPQLPELVMLEAASLAGVTDASMMLVVPTESTSIFTLVTLPSAISGVVIALLAMLLVLIP
jgi:hypothetical protein